MDTTFERSETATTRKKYKSSAGQLIYAVFLAGFTITIILMIFGYIIKINTIAEGWPLLLMLLEISFALAIVFVAVFRTASIAIYDDRIDMRLGQKRVTLPFERYLIGSYVHRQVSAPIVINSRHIRALDMTASHKDYKCLNFSKRIFSKMMEDIHLRQQSFRKKHSDADVSVKSFETFVFEIPSNKKEIIITRSMISVDNQEFPISEISQIKITPPGYLVSTIPKLEIMCEGNKFSWKIIGVGFSGESHNRYKLLCNALQDVFYDRDDIYIFEI